MVVHWCPYSRAKAWQSNCYYTGERLRFGDAICGVKKLRQVVEGCSDVGVARAVGRFSDRTRLPVQRLGLGQAVGGIKQRRQAADPRCEVGVVRTSSLDGASIKALGGREIAEIQQRVCHPSGEPGTVVAAFQPMVGAGRQGGELPAVLVLDPAV